MSTLRLLPLLLGGALVAGTGCGADSAGASPGDGTSQGTGLGAAGAQDFGRFKAILDARRIPAPSTLDQVGFFAEHNLGPPPTSCNEEVCLRGQFGQMGNLLTGTTCSVVKLGLGTPLDGSQLPRPALDLAIVVDSSATMLTSVGALAPLREALVGLLDGLEAVDVVTIVAASGAPVVLADRLPAAGAKATLAGLRSASTSDLYGAVRVAVEALGAAVPGRHRRLVVIGEGRLTAGLRNPNRVLGLVQSFAEQGGGVTAIAMGVSSEARLFEQLADAGAGALYFASSVQELPPLFAREVAYSLVPVAEKVRLRVTPGASFRLREVTGIKQFRLDDAGGAIDIPALFVAWRRTPTPDRGRRGGGGGIMMELMPRRNANPAEREVATIALDYVLPGSGETRSTTVKVTTPNEPGATPPAGYFDDPSVEKGFVVLNLYAAFRMASERASQGDHRGAFDVLKAVAQRAGEWQSRNRDAEIDEDLGYVQLFQRALIDAGALSQPERAGQFLEPWGGFLD